MKLSILIPVYNEKKTILDLLELVGNVEIDKEIVLVDDCSDDGTTQILKENFGNEKGEIRVFYHETNKGKGAAIRTALSHAAGDYVIVQDADLEYSPHDMVEMAATAERSGVEAVYGSRFLATWKTTSFVHYAINSFLTRLTNVLFGGHLTDMETCYKMIRTDIMKSLEIKANRFEFEPEVTAKLLIKGIKIVEVPVSYRGRSYDEGKKIGWRDGLEAISTLFRIKFNRY